MMREEEAHTQLAERVLQTQLKVTSEQRTMEESQGKELFSRTNRPII